MFWGLKTRIHDIEAISELKPTLVEFHSTQEDILRGTLNKTFSFNMTSHLPEYWEQVMIDPCDLGNLKKHIDIYKLCVEKSLELQKHFLPQRKLKVVIHPGGATVDPLDVNDLILWKKESLYKRLKSFVDYLEMIPAFKDNIEILVENIPPLPWFYGGQYYSNIFCDPLEIKSFCERFERNICLDISHLGLYCNYKKIDLIESIKLLKPYTKQIHIADAKGTDGEGIQIGEGTIDFNKVLNEIKDLDVAVIPETMWGHFEKFAGFKKTMSICNELLGANICH